MCGCVYLFCPVVELLTDQLYEFGMAEGEEVNDFVNPSQKLVPPELSLSDQ